MTKFLLFILLSLNLNSQTDKFYHTLAGTAITAGVCEVSYQVTDIIGLSLGLGSTVGWIIGWGKEDIYDEKWGKGYPSFDDKVATWRGIPYAAFGMTIRMQKDRERRAKSLEFINLNDTTFIK